MIVATKNFSLLPVHIAIVIPITLNIGPHLGKEVIKSLVHFPILQVPMIALKQRTGTIGAADIIEEKGIFKGKGPLEAEVASVCASKFGVFAEGGVLGEEARAQCGPGEEVDYDGVLCRGLGHAEGSVLGW